MENLFKLKNIDLLSNINMKQRLKSLAMIDAILCPEWEYRYFSFNCSWDNNEEMASMRDGEGNEYFILFKNGNIIGKVFEKSSPLTEIERNELFQKIPKILNFFLEEKAFSLQDTTLIFWKIKEDKELVYLPLNKELSYLGFLYTPEVYINWAKKYYEINFDEKTIEELFNYMPLTEERIKKLNKTLTFSDLEEDIQKISYPTLIECPVHTSKWASLKK